MIEEIPAITQPDWLMNLTPDSIANQSFPLFDVLHDSLYYPGAGTDGKPVKWLAGNTYSFVYTDYMVSREALLSALTVEHTKFRGYHILGMRDITMQELIPNGWKPMLPTGRNENPITWRESFEKPFCMWVVMERDPDFSPDHGPERFSLLYLCGEGVASYQALYNSNRVKPKILFLIQHGFGDNWTDFENQDAIFAKSVAANPAGMSDWLVGRCRSKQEGRSYWPRYYPGPYVRYLDVWHGYAVWPLGSCKQSNKPSYKAGDYRHLGEITADQSSKHFSMGVISWQWR